MTAGEHLLSCGGCDGGVISWAQSVSAGPISLTQAGARMLEQCGKGLILTIFLVVFGEQ